MASAKEWLARLGFATAATVLTVGSYSAKEAEAAQLLADKEKEIEVSAQEAKEQKYAQLEAKHITDSIKLEIQGKKIAQLDSLLNVRNSAAPGDTSAVGRLQQQRQSTPTREGIY